jgi:hypothetical protein
MKSLLPVDGAPVITPITKHGQPIAKSNYRVMATGRHPESFLHVFEAGPKTQTAMRPTSLVMGDVVEGAEVVVGPTTWVTMFARTNLVLNGSVSYAFSTRGPHQHLVADVPKNRPYKVTVTAGGEEILKGLEISSTANGLLGFSFNAREAGRVVVTPADVPDKH